MFTEQQARTIDNAYYDYLKNLFLAGKSEQPIPESEQAMLNGIITVDECFMLEMLANA